MVQQYIESNNNSNITNSCHGQWHTGEVDLIASRAADDIKCEQCHAF